MTEHTDTGGTLDAACEEGAARLLRHCLAAGLSDAQLVLPRSLIVAVIDATVAEVEALGLAVVAVES